MHSARFLLRQIPVDLLDLPPVGKILAQPDTDINGEENAQIGQRSPQIQSAPSQQQRHHPERGRCDAKVRGGGSEQTPRLHLPDDRTSAPTSPDRKNCTAAPATSEPNRAAQSGAQGKYSPKQTAKIRRIPLLMQTPSGKPRALRSRICFFMKKPPVPV